MSMSRFRPRFRATPNGNRANVVAFEQIVRGTRRTAKRSWLRAHWAHGVLAAAPFLGVGGAWAWNTMPAPVALFAREPVVEQYTTSFERCSGPERSTCVVDGDTFWLEGTKIRIADINTPEVSEPQCAAEAELGERATERLVSLLNARGFSLETIDRDEDVYGRKLRIVSRGGKSLGNTLVDEGLAEPWTGSRRNWC